MQMRSGMRAAWNLPVNCQLGADGRRLQMREESLIKMNSRRDMTGPRIAAQREERAAKKKEERRRGKEGEMIHRSWLIMIASDTHTKNAFKRGGGPSPDAIFCAPAGDCDDERIDTHLHRWHDAANLSVGLFSFYTAHSFRGGQWMEPRRGGSKGAILFLGKGFQ